VTTVAFRAFSEKHRPHRPSDEQTFHLFSFPPFCCLSESNASVDLSTVTLKEKELKRGRDEPEKLMKQWSSDRIESDKDTDYEDLKDVLQRVEVEKARTDSIELNKKQSGESKILPEVGKSESREIFRRPSEELDYGLSGELSKNDTKGLEKRLPEVGREETEKLGKAREIEEIEKEYE
jgi:hypothetical protein